MDSSSAAATSRKTNQNIQVYVRVRPLNSRERAIRSNEVVEALPKEIVVRYSHDAKMTKKFTFDRAFGQESKQCEVYQSVVAPLIEEVLSGYNCTVFAYGQTGTGKTHTMIGTESPELQSSWEDETMVGIIPRALSHLFDELRLMELEFTMRVSYLELYNEELCDLLSSDDSVKIRIFDDSTKKGSVIIQGLEEIVVNSKNDVYKLLEKGKDRRKTATTLMNAQSSRSHTVFSILVHIKESGIDGEEMLKIGKLNLVDLAGSENISKAGNEKGIRARETVNINQSLLTLGRVITALVERTPHIPYRESKLTRLLQESLGGRTKTSIIATISPGHKDLEETLSTLDYAHRAKNIQNKPELNQKLTKKTVLREYTEEIDRLKRDLMAARDKNGIYLAEETYNDMHYRLDCQNKELNEKMLLVKVLKDEMLNKEKIFNEVSLNLVEKTEELKKTENVLNETKTALDQTKKVLTTTKRRYKEKKIIVTNHIKTEEKLSGQANTLLQVADKVTEEHSKLQDTLERRKDVDITINTVCEQFKEKMKLSFNSMNKDMKLLYTNHNSISKVIKDEIENNIKCHNNYTNQTANKIDEIALSYENSFHDFGNCMSKYTEQFKNLKDDNKELINSMFNDLKEKEIQRYHDLKLFLYNISQQISEKHKIQEKNKDCVLKFLELTDNSIKIYTETTQNKYTKIIENLRESLEEAISKNQSNIETQKTNSQQNYYTILEMEKLLGKMKQFVTENNKNIQITENINSDLINSNKNCGIEIRNMEEIDDLKVKLNNNILKIQSITNNSNHELTDKFKVCNRTLAENNKEIDNLVTERLKSFDALTKVNEATNKNEIDMIENHEIDIKNKIEVLTSISKHNCEAIKKPVIEENGRVKNLTTQQSSFINSLDSDVQKYSNNFEENIKECSEILNHFHESELKTYTSTGETPNRKNFSYPKILASTSPHENIVRRFRIENQWSDTDSTILEDTEANITNLSDYFIPINSTPIKGVNFERPKHVHNTDRMVLSALGEHLTETFTENSNSVIDCDLQPSKNSTILITSNHKNKENIS